MGGKKKLTKASTALARSTVGSASPARTHASGASFPVAPTRSELPIGYAEMLGEIKLRIQHKVVVEYALRHLKRPVGVAGWETKLVEELPKALEGSLPTVEQIEAELSDDLRTKPRARRRKS